MTAKRSDIRKMAADRAIAQPGKSRWTRAHKEAFLDALTETLSVTISANRIGMNRNTPHHFRRKEGWFRDGWEAAAAIGDAFPDIATMQEQDGIVLAGRGLRARMLRDARLRRIGGLLR